jgi:hypothetical protein
MRRALQITAGFVGGLVLLAAWMAVSSPYWDGPFTRIPGGAFSGEPYRGPEPDWGDVADRGTVELQVDPGQPHSVTVGVVELGGEVFVPATLRPDEKRWSLALLDDPRAVLRVDGRLFERVAERVDDPGLFADLIDRAKQKYNPSYFEPDKTWFFRLVRPPA